MSGESTPAAGASTMSGRILSVGGLTLVSRVAGFFRDIMLAAILGAGPVADAFFVALRLPNHFRAIFAEGAFNAAFIPAFARVREQQGASAAGLLADRIFTMLLSVQLALLALAFAFMPWVIQILAPGFAHDGERFALAVALSRITFPYLLLITLVTLFGGMLNAVNRFAAAAGAPILLNLSMIVALALAAFFPTAGHAAAWGVLAAGVLEFLLLAAAARRAGLTVAWRWPRIDQDIRRFFRALGPATVGSAGVQIALFADTIIASFLTVGALSALYYADRLNQLPIGVIGIAIGTVLLPEMARRVAAGDEAGARDAQNRAITLTLVLAMPCVAAFVAAPELIVRALFTRGAFTAADADTAGATLRAYALGLIPFVLIRSMVATFFARGDTLTPVKASLTAAGVNVALKFALMGPLAQVGLALATAVGAWVNIGLVGLFAWRAGLFSIDRRLGREVAKLLAAGGILGMALFFAAGALMRLFAGWRFHDELALLALMAVGAIVYAVTILVLFRGDWRSLVRA